MKNTEIFEDYDMVVSITQQTINDQLTHLQRMGIIHSSLRLVQEIDEASQNYVYKVLQPNDPIPPNCAYIDGLITPQINIAESGEIVTFLLNFRSGTAAFWTGNGPLARLVKSDMKNWVYAIAINLDLTKLEADDLNKKIKVPDNVRDQLENFNSQMFDVNHLFMDFESTDLLRFDPQQTKTGSAGDTAQEQMVLFMQFYLSDLVRTGNPYILGYSLTTNDKTAQAADANLAPMVRPVSTTYTMYQDLVTPVRSTLNFVLATQGGHGKVTGTPGVFDTNWIAPSDTCDAMMIYSHAVLIEAMILKPFFTQFSQQVYEGIKDQISVDQGNDYATAVSATPTGFSYTISDTPDGNDNRYQNIYTVDFVNSDGQVAVNLKGQLMLYKEVEQNDGLLHPKASATFNIGWSAVYTLSLNKDASGQPKIQIDHSSNFDPPATSTWMNDDAKAMTWIGKILGSLLDFCTGFLDQGFMGNLFANLLSVNVPDVGNVDAAVGDLGDNVGTMIMMPAGDVFAFKQPASDPLGNLSMQLIYKSET